MLTALWMMPASAQHGQVVIVTPGHPSPPMRPPVVVVPGQYAPPSDALVVEGRVDVQLPACPPQMPCPPPCPPMGPCPPPPCACSASIEYAPTPEPIVTPSPSQPEPVVMPSTPAPGTLQLAYSGAWDGHTVLHGGAFRFTGHIDDIWFIEGELGGKGARTPTFNLGEFQFVLGPRVMAPIIPSVLRLYGTLATGIIVRSVGDMITWGIWPVQLGGGLEVGAPLTDNWSIGGFIDFRGELRIPFERDPISVGFTWSAGVAFMWF